MASAVALFAMASPLPCRSAMARPWRNDLSASVRLPLCEFDIAEHVEQDRLAHRVEHLAEARHCLIEAALRLVVRAGGVGKHAEASHHAGLTAHVPNSRELVECVLEGGARFLVAAFVLVQIGDVDEENGMFMRNVPIVGLFLPQAIEAGPRFAKLHSRKRGVAGPQEGTTGLVAARAWVEAFVHWCNTQHFAQRHSLRHPITTVRLNPEHDEVAGPVRVA
jgi:hypothetical protein